MRPLLIGIAVAILLILPFGLHFTDMEDLGLNQKTLGFTGVVLFGLWGSRGLIIQNAKIWHRERGKSVPTSWFLFFAFMFVSTYIYGAESHRFALLFQGAIRTFFHIPLIIGLAKFKKFGWFERWVLAALTLAIVLNILSEDKAWCYFVFSAGGIFASATQVFEIRKNGTGEVAWQFLAVYAASSIFWMLYGFAFQDWKVFVVSLGYLTVHAITLPTFFLAHRREQEAMTGELGP